MKSYQTAPKFYHQSAKLTVFLILTAAFLFAWQTVGNLQSRESVKTDKKTDKKDSSGETITVHAAGRGNPFVNFTDGANLIAPGNAANDNSQPAALASADFDSDGVDDLLTADTNGNLKFYHGKGLAKYAGLTESGAETPFEATGKSFALNISPDFLLTGDFNADGQKDILAAKKGANFLTLLQGNGKGSFAPPSAIALTGQITALATGEIGRRDGQTDVAVALTGRAGSFLAVFEHPEGAFKHKPEVFKLSSPATDLAIGNLNGDFYGDIAAASGSILTIVQGRGQAYPWDLLPDSGIKRPAASVAARKMPFGIAALTVGRFGTQRGESLALLGQDGNLYRLEPRRAEKPSNEKLLNEMKAQTTQNLFVPTGADARNLVTIAAPPISPEEDRQSIKSTLGGDEISDAQKKRMAEQLEKYKNTDKKEIQRLTTEDAAKALEKREKAKAAFVKSIAGKPSTLAGWTIETIIANSSLANAAASNSLQKMLRVNVSDSNLDDILLLDPVSSQIQIVSRIRNDDQSPQTEVTSLDVENGLQAVLPMRLNGDAMSDLVVLRKGANAPSVVMSSFGQLIVVTSETDEGNCQPDNACSLRNAILISNLLAGQDQIIFLGGLNTIKPSSELPIITDSVFIYGDRGDNLLPFVEISGENLTGGAADGLRIRTSNASVSGLAINRFPSILDNNGSQIGGNGISIFSTTGSPNNGNNVIQGNFLGTDKTGSLDRGNDATGLNIFDSDNNFIGGTNSADRNVVSGNGSQQKNGAGISLTAGNSNTFQGNVIGLNSLGTGKLGNSRGLFFTGANNTFGGDEAGAGNTVSGNGEAYFDSPEQCGGMGMDIIALINLDTGELLTSNNTISGNRLGTNPAGTTGLGNCWRGVNFNPIAQTLFGSITPNGRNIVSDNGLDALHCEDSFLPFFLLGGGCLIVGNNIGTDVTGQISIPNDSRNQRNGIVFITATVFVADDAGVDTVGSPGGTTPNGACTGFCNLISGNSNDNVSLTALAHQGYGVTGIFNNFIGTNKDGNQALRNAETAVITGKRGTAYVGGVGSDENGNQIALGNLLSGNDVYGIGAGDFFGSDTDFSTAIIQGNLIGTDTTGQFAVPNGGSQTDGGGGGAVSVSGLIGTQVLIGGSDPAARNIISGNTNINGISLFGLGSSVQIVNNLIGLNRSLNALGNGNHGITLASIGVQVGGSTPAEGNQIAYNGTQGNNYAGVLVYGGGYGNTVRNNSIYSNSGLGIDLTNSNSPRGSDGVTANDCHLDPDTGTNDLQNFPLLFEPVQNADGTLSVSGTMDSQADQTFAIDFYASQTADPSNYGEGAIYLGSVNTETDRYGQGEFVFTSSTPVSSNLAITATATDQYGSTSEFSCAAGQCTNGVKTLAEYRAKFGDVPPNPCALIEPIVVNIVTDEDDADTTDQHCDVNVQNDVPDECSLRAALEVAEQRPGPDVIEFSIPGLGVHTIVPLSPLPVINHPVNLNANTQVGYTDHPLVEIRGDGGGGQYGLVAAGTGSINIRSLVINRFQFAGIFLTQGNGNSVKNCYLGIDPDGSTAAGARQQIGIWIQNSSRNYIGGAASIESNVISNNVTAILVQGSSNQNNIVNDKIGTNSAGDTPIPNDDGIVLDGVNSNVVGDDFSPESANIIAGNQRGVVIKNGSKNNKVIGNLLAGIGSFGNASVGVSLESGAKNNFIGGEASNERNIIGGSAMNGEGVGVLIKSDASTGNTVTGNYIGFNNLSDGNLPNDIGIKVGASQTTIGKENAPNYIGGNSVAGILLTAPNNGSISDVSIIANYIGVNSIGVPHANGIGINLNGSLPNLKILKNQIAASTAQGIRVNGSNYKIGGNSAAEANLIYDNTEDGIFFEPGVTGNQINYNFIGTLPYGSFSPNKNGILLRGSGHTVTGNIISSNRAAGIRIEGDETNTPQENTISMNLIGTNSDGNQALPNKRGIELTKGARKNTLDQNTISGNTEEGIRLGAIEKSGQLVSENVLTGNMIGTNKDGDLDVPNMDGIILSNGAQYNRIDGTIFENVISGNTGNGILLTKFDVESGSDATTIPPNNNTIIHNRIGVSKTTVSPTVALPNKTGILITNGANNNLIGGTLSFGTQPHEGNLISGNSEYGIKICNFNPSAAILCGTNQTSTNLQPFHNKVRGNVIGLPNFIPRSGEEPAVPNGGGGIYIGFSSSNIIGNDRDNAGDFGNVICANGADGIKIVGDLENHDYLLTKDNVIVKNYIGVRPDHPEFTGFGNGRYGIYLESTQNTLVGFNVIGNSPLHAIKAFATMIFPRKDNPQIKNLGFTPSITIVGNLIGVARDATGAIINAGNGGDGINLENVSDAEIGVAGQSPETKNIIAGNSGSGISIIGVDSFNNSIKNNLVGTDENGNNFGNSSDGILIKNEANQNKVGENFPDSGNTIAYNGGAGVRIDETAGQSNLIDPNTIFANTGLGIDLGTLGHTPNDGGDADEGGNRGQNFPEIVSKQIVNNELIVGFKVDSAPENSDYGANGLYVEFFKSDGSGEGERFLGFTYYTVADHDGALAGTKTVNLGDIGILGITAADLITATATDAGNNTSEFFPPFVPTAAQVTISGHVLTATGQGISRAHLTLTNSNGERQTAVSNSFGNYRFENVRVGETYVISVTSNRFTFQSPARVLSILEENSEIIFVALP
jgi:CSLREA domain-containing protein